MFITEDKYSSCAYMEAEVRETEKGRGERIVNVGKKFNSYAGKSVI